MSGEIINSDSILAYVEKFGNKGAKNLDILRKNIDYLDLVVKTEIGAAIMKEDIARCSELMDKSYMDELEIEEKAELKYLKIRLARIALKLRNSEELRADIEKQIVKL